MKFNESTILILEKYFPQLFEGEDYWNIKSENTAYDISKIKELQIIRLRKFAKKYKIENYIEELNGVLLCCFVEYVGGIGLKKLKPKIKVSDIEMIKINSVFSSNLIKVTFVSKEGRVIVQSPINLKIIKKALEKFIDPPAKSLKSYSKLDEERVALRNIVKLLLDIFSKEIPLNVSNKKKMYLAINSFLKIIIGDYFESNESSPEDNIKKLLQLE